ncbi:hypothetical protein [Chroogloeocystis siderophila]|nr:hypothetical protein [Chroogloeocystis siderophila]
MAKPNDNKYIKKLFLSQTFARTQYLYLLRIMISSIDMPVQVAKNRLFFLKGSFMAFIKIENVVINTNYIAAIKLDNQTISGESSVSLLMATPKLPLFQIEGAFPNHYHYEWIDFVGREAKALKDYFTSFNNVIDLLPQPCKVKEM